MSMADANGFAVLLAVRQATSLFPAFLLLTATVGLCLILSMSWIWEHRAAARRKDIALLNGLAEEILGAGSRAVIYEKLTDTLADFSGATRVHLYFYDRGTRQLEKLRTDQDSDEPPIDPESPPSGLAMGVALAFRNKMLFNIPDTRRSAILVSGFKGPRSVLFVPLLTEGDVLGVLQVDHDAGVRDFSPEQRGALQHLGNIVAASVNRQEQEGAREHSFPNGRLVSGAHLISGVAGELRAPLEKIAHAANRLLASEDDPAVLAQLRVVSGEIQRASDVAGRLIAFGRSDAAPSRPVEINRLVSDLVRGREREWKSLGIDAQIRLSQVPLESAAPEGQFAQLLINILSSVERAAAESEERKLSLATGATERKAVVELAYSLAESACAPCVETGIWKAMARGCGAEIRFSRPGPRTSRIEIELPLSAGAPDRGEAAHGSCQETRTTLMVEPDPAAQKKLLKDLSAHRHRVVPVVSAEEGLDLAQRMRFDVVMCSTHLPGLNWVEFFERVREFAGVFVLMIDGFQLTDGPWLDPADGLILNRLIYDSDVERVLREAETALERERAGVDRPVKPGSPA
jgi:GAF domain-containing protein